MYASKRTPKEQMQYMLLWLLFILVSCICSILVDLLLMKITTTIVKLSPLTEAILRAVFMLLGASAPIAAISYLISYHLGEFCGLTSFFEGALALLLQLPLCILLGFPSWITGGVKWLAGVIEYGSNFYRIEDASDIGLTNYLIAFVTFGAFYLIVKYLFGVLGRNKRIRDRIELTGSPLKPTDNG